MDQKNKKIFTHDKPLQWVGLVFSFALLERVALAAVYPVRVYNDTGAYRKLAEAILAGWGPYDGTRTPGYPAFLALLGSNENVYVAQLAMGLVMTLLFFYMGWQAAGSPRFGALVALAHTLNPGQLFFEANLMTETLATFWVVLAVAGAFTWFRFPGWRKLPLAAGIGLSAALAGLTRPLYVPLALWIGVFLAVLPLIEQRRSIREWFGRLDWRVFLGVSIPALLLTGVWVNFLHRSYHMWNITTLTGYNLIQHTGYYFEYTPDEYAALRDTYIKFRDERIARYGTQGNAIWDAIPEMQRVSGLSFFDLSRTLARISLRLIREHPGLYLHYVLRGWWLYWRAPVYWVPDHLRLSALAPLVNGWVLAARGLLIAANLSFLITSLLAAVSRKLRQRWNITPFLAFLAATLWVFSIAQTLPDHGDNPRFLIPMQTLVVFWTLWILRSEWQRRRTARKAL